MTTRVTKSEDPMGVWPVVRDNVPDASVSRLAGVGEVMQKTADFIRAYDEAVRDLLEAWRTNSTDTTNGWMRINDAIRGVERVYEREKVRP